MASTGKTGRGNPRHANGALRRKYRARFRAMNAPCGICGGRLGEIHYDEPSDAAHPLSFVIDEIVPISKFYAGGYAGPVEAAKDFGTLQAAHFCCNAAKGNKLPWEPKPKTPAGGLASDGSW